MKIIVGVLVIILFVLISLGNIQVNSISLSTNNNRYLMSQDILEETYLFNVTCAKDTDIVDIVFAIDSTSSMGTYLYSARASIGDFITLLESDSYNYNLGGVTFGDGTNIWDFDPSTPTMNDLTGELSEFVPFLDGCTAMGGDDTPESSLDAIYDAITHYEWRDDSRKIVIMFTDAPFCAEDFPTPGSYCYSSTDISTEDLTELAISTNTSIFILYPTYRTGPEYDYYQSLALTSGGQYYDITSGFMPFFRDIVEHINSYESVNIEIQNTGDEAIDWLELNLISGDCIATLSPTEKNFHDFLPDVFLETNWRIAIDSSCYSTERCFSVVIESSTGFTDTLYGCTTNDDCVCETPVVELISPSYGIISACEFQNIVWHIVPAFDDLEIDHSSIVISINSDEFTILDDEIAFTNDTLIFTPLTAWIHGDSIYACLEFAMDNLDCPISEPICTYFIIDTQAPEILLRSPIDSILIDYEHDFIFTFDDDIAGLDSSILEISINEELYNYSNEWFEFSYTPVNSQITINSDFFSEWEIIPDDSLEICFTRFDLVDESNCGPNSETSCYTWIFVNYDHNIWLPEYHAVPCNVIEIPVLIDTVHSNLIYSISASFEFNPEILYPFDISLSPEIADWEYRTVFDSIAGTIDVSLSGDTPLSYSDSIVFYIIATVNCTATGGDFCGLQILDFQFNDGFPNANFRDGFFIALWRVQEWIIEMRINSIDYLLEDQTLAIGGSYSSDEFYNAGNDLIILPPVPSRIDARLLIDDDDYPYLPGFRRDMRGMTAPIEWKIISYEHSMADSAIIEWNSSRLPEGVFMMNDEINMKNFDSYVFQTNDTIKIKWTQPRIISDTITFCTGWNLISFPTLPVTDNLEYIALSDIGIFDFNSCENVYFRPEYLEKGHGYWVFSDNDTSISIGGIPIYSFERSLCSGWNLIGSVSGNIPLLEIPEITSEIFYFNCSSRVYETSDTLKSGFAYWIYFDERGRLLLDF